MQLYGIASCSLGKLTRKRYPYSLACAIAYVLREEYGIEDVGATYSSGRFTSEVFDETPARMRIAKQEAEKMV